VLNGEAVKHIQAYVTL